MWSWTARARNFTYTTTIFDPAIGDPTHTLQLINGPDRPPLDQASTYSANTIPNAPGYQWRTSKLNRSTSPTVLRPASPTSTGGRRIRPGQHELRRGRYLGVPPTNSLAGGVAGHGPQTLTLKWTLVPNANSLLTFKTSAHFVLAAEHPVTAVVEVSPDDGVTWQTLNPSRRRATRRSTTGRYRSASSPVNTSSYGSVTRASTGGASTARRCRR